MTNNTNPACESQHFLENSKNFFLRESFFLIPLIFAIFKTVDFITDYSMGWVLVEAASWKPSITAWGFPDSLASLKHALDWPMFEFEPRITRPLSNLFELFDTSFRAIAWGFVPPLPSLSLTWPFTLVIAPTLLFLLLRRLGIERWLALLSTALYVANPGVLSLEVMVFRPGKAMTIVALLFCLWLAAGLDRAQRDGTLGDAALSRRFWLLSSLGFISFFWDETALILWPALFLLYPRLVTRTWWTIAGFLAMPIAYIISIKFVLPWLTILSGAPSLTVHDYSPAQKALSILTLNFKEIGLPSPYELTSYFAKNNILILSDTFGLVPPWITKSEFYYMIFSVTLLSGMLALKKVITHVMINVKKPLSLKKSLFSEDKNSQLIRICALFFASLMYQTFIMSFVINHIWGLYYYGVFCVVFIIIFFAKLCQLANIQKKIVYVFVFSAISGTTFIFPATNKAYKNAHFYPYKPLIIYSIFNNTINRFEIKGYSGSFLREKTTELWLSREKRTNAYNIPTELGYIIYETLGKKSGCEFRKSLAFDLTWQEGTPTVTCR